MLKLVDEYFHEKDMKWEKFVGVCTDGAPAMLGCPSGFIARIKQNNPDVVGTQCVIHRQTLASVTLPAAMKNKLAIIIRIENFIKSSAVNSRLFAKLCKDMDSNYINLLFHTNIRELSKGTMLARAYDLKDEVSILLESQGQQDLLLPFQSEEFQLAMAHLVDIFKTLNRLNLLLQGKKIKRLNDYNAMHAFIEKLGCNIAEFERKSQPHFLPWTQPLRKAKPNCKSEFKAEVESHLQILKEEYDRYFPDLGNVELADWKMTRNPFRINEDILLDNLQELLEIKCNSTAKDDFEAMSLNDFRAKY